MNSTTIDPTPAASRSSQLERLVDLFAAVSTGPSRNVVILTGEAGLGKSTILREALQRLSACEASIVTAVVECSTPLAGHDIGELESLQPWESLIGMLASSENDRRLGTRRLVTDLAKAWIRCIPVVGDVLESVADTAEIVRDHTRKGPRPAGEQAANREQLFQQYINMLRELSTRSPLLIVIDDVHWADASSVNLLFAAARQLRGLPILFVVAYRDDDAASARGGEGHPILHIRNELERYDMIEGVELARLTPEEIDAILRGRYDTYENDDRFEEWLARACGGNALFVVQFLETLESDGVIDRERGRVVGDYESVVVPGSVDAVLRERVRRLDEEAREILRYASVEGDVFTAAILSAVTETPKLKLLSRLRRIAEGHQVVLDLGKRVVYARETTAWRFMHALLHRSMYESLGEEERELLHEMVLDVLTEEWESAREEGTNVEGFAARIAAHAEVLGRWETAASALVVGGEACMREFAYGEGRHLFERASAMVEKARRSSRPSRELDELEIRIAKGLGEMYQREGRYDDSLRHIRRLVEAAQRIGDEDREIEALAMLVDVLRLKGEHVDSEALARELMERTASAEHPVLRAMALNSLGLVLQSSGRYRDALEPLTQAIELLEKTDRRRQLAMSINNLALLRANLGEIEGLTSEFERSAEIFRSIDTPVGEAIAVNNLGLVQYRMRRFDEALEEFRRSVAISARIGDRPAQAMGAVNIGITLVFLGRLDEAERELERGMAEARAIGYQQLLARAQVNLANVYEQRGDLERALELVRESLELSEQTSNMEGIATALLGIGALERQVGRPEAARAPLERAVTVAREMGSDLILGDALAHLGLAICESAGDADTRGGGVALMEEGIAMKERLGTPDAAEWRGRMEEVR